MLARYLAVRQHLGEPLSHDSIARMVLSFAAACGLFDFGVFTRTLRWKCAVQRWYLA